MISIDLRDKLLLLKLKLSIDRVGISNELTIIDPLIVPPLNEVHI